MPTRDEIVAHHEAGHVVAAWRLRIPILRVTIVSDGLAEGVTSCPAFPESIWDTLEYESESFKARRFAEGHIMFGFAGSIAEAMFDPKPRESTAEWDHDLNGVLTLALKMTGSEEESFLYQQWLYERTKNLMARPDSIAAVQGVVAALLEQRTLSGRAARQAARGGVDRYLKARMPRIPAFQVEAAE